MTWMRRQECYPVPAPGPEQGLGATRRLERDRGPRGLREETLEAGGVDSLGDAPHASGRSFRRWPDPQRPPAPRIDQKGVRRPVRRPPASIDRRVHFARG
jgi:hypothetical protein